MKLTRFLKPSQIKLELATKNPAEIPEDVNPQKLLWQNKEAIIVELADLLDTSGKVVKKKKLLTDLVNRERKSSTAIGAQIAIPHVRTMQARDFAVAFARSAEGVDFDAPDGEPVKFFFAVVSPPYDDKFYLQIYKSIGMALSKSEIKELLLNATTEHEIIKIFSELR